MRGQISGVGVLLERPRLRPARFPEGRANPPRRNRRSRLDRLCPRTNTSNAHTVIASAELATAGRTVDCSAIPQGYEPVHAPRDMIRRPDRPAAGHCDRRGVHRRRRAVRLATAVNEGLDAGLNVNLDFQSREIAAIAALGAPIVTRVHHRSWPPPGPRSIPRPPLITGKPEASRSVYGCGRGPGVATRPSIRLTSITASACGGRYLLWEDIAGAVVELVVEVHGGADQGEVAEGLREVADLLAGRADLLGVQP